MQESRYIDKLILTPRLAKNTPAVAKFNPALMVSTTAVRPFYNTIAETRNMSVCC